MDEIQTQPHNTLRRKTLSRLILQFFFNADRPVRSASYISLATVAFTALITQFCFWAFPYFFNEAALPDFVESRIFAIALLIAFLASWPTMMAYLSMTTHHRTSVADMDRRHRQLKGQLTELSKMQERLWWPRSHSENYKMECRRNWRKHLRTDTLNFVTSHAPDSREEAQLILASVQGEDIVAAYQALLLDVALIPHDPDHAALDSLERFGDFVLKNQLGGSVSGSFACLGQNGIIDILSINSPACFRIGRNNQVGRIDCNFSNEGDYNAWTMDYTRTMVLREFDYLLLLSPALARQLNLDSFEKQIGELASVWDHDPCVLADHLWEACEQQQKDSGGTLCLVRYQPTN